MALYFPRAFGSLQFGKGKFSHGTDGFSIHASQVLGFTQTAVLAHGRAIAASQVLGFTQTAFIRRFIDVNAAQALPLLTMQTDLRTKFWFDTTPPAGNIWDGEKLPCGGEWVADPAGGSDWGVR